MKKNALLLLLVWSIAACTDSPPIQNLSVEEFRQKLDATSDKTILDVRTDAEVAGGMIPGAVQLDIQGSDVEAKLTALDPSRPVFVYCAVGGRSSAMATLLSQKGFKEIYNAEGGMTAWQSAGYPVAPGQTDQH